MAEEEVSLKQKMLDPEFFSLLSVIPMDGGKYWIRRDLFEDKPAFQAWLEHMTPYDTYEVIAEFAYLGVKTGNVIIRAA
jgi:hypothetical protein